MNQRKVGVILSYAEILITSVISLVYTRYMLQIMGQSEYGLFSTASSYISYLSLFSFGIGGSYIRFNAQARVKGDKEEERRLNGMYLTIFTALSLLVLFGGIIIEILASRLVENTFTEQEIYKLRIIMAIMIANTMVTFICNVFMMALQSYEKFFFIRVVCLGATIIQPIINMIALKHGGRSIALACMTIIGSILTYLIFFIYARREIKFEVSFHGFRRDVLKEITIFSGFLFLNSITDQITFSTDNVILSATKGTTAVAIYNIGATFKTYFMQMSTAISSVFSPRINHIVANNGDMNSLNDLFIRVGRVQFYVISLVLIGYCSIGKRFIQLWAGEEYKDSFYIGLLLMFAVTVPLFQNVGLEIQKAMNKHKARSVVYFFISLANVAMTIPLCKRWGGIGAALATTICMFAGTVLFMNYYYERYLHLEIKKFWSSIISILPGLAIPVIVAVGVNRCFPMDSFGKLLIGVVLITVSFLASTYWLSMNRYERGLIRSLFRRFKKHRG